MTLNDAKARTAVEDAPERHYAVADLTLENGTEEALNASDAEYLLRDEEGYSFEKGSLPEQKPQPEGQVTPGGKASGEVAFDLGTKSPEGSLTLSVSLSGKQDVAPALFEFEVQPVEEKPESKPQVAEKEKSEAKDVSDRQTQPAEPDYQTIAAPSGGLTVEVPPDWEAETGSASEGEGGPNSWSYYAGEDITASITTARSLDAWKGLAEGPTSGAYVVASRTLAQNFTDEELIYSQLLANKANKCAEGPYEEFNRGPYSVKMQEWYGCGINGTTSLVAAASPEGRECVVVMDIILASDADRMAAQHILDSFEVDCGVLPAPAANDASATVSASASASAEAEADASADADGPSSGADSCPNTRITPDGVQCSNLPDVIPGSSSPDPNSPEPDSPSSAPPAPSDGGQCPQGGRWVGVDGPGDGDSDGCAGE